MKEKEHFFYKIYNLGIIKFGCFTLKSGMNSPIYIDFRPIASRPDLLIKLSDLILKEVPYHVFELICGVPYAALPIATTLSLRSNIPLIIKRKENKGYGTKRMIEGIYKKGQNCLLIEDVITSGDSLLKTVIDLEKEGLIIKNILSILDREQGGIENLKNRGFNIRSLFRLGEILKMLKEKNLLKKEEIHIIQFFFKKKKLKNIQGKRISYEEKKEKISHPIGKKLLDIALKKQTNLIVSADLIYSEEILKLVNLIGDKICGLKIHVDIISDFSFSFIDSLKKISMEKKFLLFEDRKLCDVGPTNYLQLHYGIHKISSWADIITVHVLAGSESIQNLNIPSNMGVITISEMSSSGRLSDDNYIRKALNISLKNSKVIGTVAQRKVDDRLLLFTPGIHFSDSKENCRGNTYIHPNQAFIKNSSDFIIVGKAIYQSNNPKILAEKYRNSGWKAYENVLFKKNTLSKN
ncbi:MAG: orotidine-5'-phosphate decarboxylase [Flavobacteriales bacterium]|jgi:uridine monophosphate synthetase|uniref:orotidine-5'-phosphate decarboxylase n=1 Tax=Blattabacterium sp. (Mastotermes darwiniensis) TaxID=39768 RepID=UPI000231DDEF|nr:orotidine-5'-phosphate decarboxylase [Blattabacterium sp. (Mastotermes darwiniensis)]AER40547.1 bifunctional orotate phosphoribosyltransferase/orotidine 5'-phosphate decarboxylase [Blattabacterium sp. (Mastotermes darwiniensis) str. MADAR]MDR1805044.1 orotidine-5'-phosphate decarboxylase [Flavobacteriales bacterium]